MFCAKMLVFVVTSKTVDMATAWDMKNKTFTTWNILPNCPLWIWASRKRGKWLWRQFQMHWHIMTITMYNITRNITIQDRCLREMFCIPIYYWSYFSMPLSQTIPHNFPWPTTALSTDILLCHCHWRSHIISLALPLPCLLIFQVMMPPMPPFFLYDPRTMFFH